MKPPTALGFGLPKGSPVPAGMDPNKVAKALDEMVSSCGASAYDVEFFWITPEDGLDGAVAKLKSKAWDIVIIGFGVRGLPEHTPMFEGLVNAVRTHSPQAKFCFNSTPTNTVESLQRVWPLKV
ncbi:hypothetical protein T439DRAFT_321561 [Meredithblackwellia eburnea MCA 4105]